MGIMIPKPPGPSSLQNVLIIHTSNHLRCKSKCFSTLVAELHRHHHTVTMIFHPNEEIDDLIMKCCNQVGDAVL